MRGQEIEDFLYAKYVSFDVTDKDDKVSTIVCLGTMVMQCYNDRNRWIYTVPPAVI